MWVSQETGVGIWYSDFFKNFPPFVVIHTVKRFRVVSEAEIHVFSGTPLFFRDPANVGNLISGSSVSLKPSLHI